MKHYGPTPPWEGRSRYGSWRKGALTWDDVQEWIYVDPPHGTLGWVTEVLRDHYMVHVQELLNQETAFLDLMLHEKAHMEVARELPEHPEA